MTKFSHFPITYDFGTGIRIYGVDHTYISLIVRFRNIFESLNRSFPLSKGLVPLIVIFKFEDVLFLNGTFGISLSSLFLIMCSVFSLFPCVVIWSFFWNYHVLSLSRRKSVNRSFQLSKGLSSLFLIMEDSVFLMACSHGYWVMVTYISVKSAFILLGTCVRTMIIISDAFKSMIVNSVDFVSSCTF